MATYKEIQERIRKKHKITVRMCWIADIKRKDGLIIRKAWNRINPRRIQDPCPESKKGFIEEALKQFGMI
jgi:hypothetical protein